MDEILGWAFLICVCCGALLCATWFWSYRTEQQEIRREKRTGLTPPHGTPAPEYRVPVPWIHATQTGISEIAVELKKHNEQTLSALRRIEDTLAQMAPKEEGP